MLLHMKHTHTPEKCPAHDPERLASMRKVLDSAAEKGVRIQSALVNAPAHVFFFVLDVDSMDHLTKWWEPLLEWGQGEVIPVTELKATGAHLEALKNKK
jgi:hypothetical protein